MLHKAFLSKYSDHSPSDSLRMIFHTSSLIQLMIMIPWLSVFCLTKVYFWGTLYKRIKLNSEGRRFTSPKCESCGIECTTCRWEIRPNRRLCDSLSNIICSAKTSENSKTVKSLPFQLAEFGPMEALERGKDFAFLKAV